MIPSAHERESQGRFLKDAPNATRQADPAYGPAYGNDELRWTF